jgi:hypothetical protein
MSNLNKKGQLVRRRLVAVNPVVLILLLAILVALIVLIWTMWPKKEKEGSRPEKITTEIDTPAGVIRKPKKEDEVPPSPPPVKDPSRIKLMYKEGKTYEVKLQAALQARATDKRWILADTVINLGYMADMSLRRKIESNNGEKIVELRTFDKSRNAKFACEVDFKISLGPIGTLAVQSLDFIEPGLGTGIILAKPLVESLASKGIEAIIKDKGLKAIGHIESLEGKTFRIAYEDGQGVTSIMPEGCNMTVSEKNFVFATAILSDCYIMPDVSVEIGEEWEVDGSQLSGYIDPSLRGLTSGIITVERNAGGKDHAKLEIVRGILEINSSDGSKKHIGQFTPRGSFRFSFQEGFVETADLHGTMRIENVSTDHILFETSFKTQPRVQLRYSCKLK